MEKKEYYTLEEAAQLLGRNRATVYNRMGLIKMKGHKFKGDRKTYLSAAEVDQLKNVFEKPWLAGEDDNKSGTSSENGKVEPAA
jgi:hypothetical protein